ncbi:MAG: hypothetical protein CBC48_08535 [bacterium TMED88]|nr:hypothetical protein [Deltaproteobacteria bacterium]OUV32256.1 MAG: hypothetical protein CBC48_08535 [bacterium TMED88]
MPIRICPIFNASLFRVLSVPTESTDPASMPHVDRSRPVRAFESHEILLESGSQWSTEASCVRSRFWVGQRFSFDSANF